MVMRRRPKTGPKAAKIKAAARAVATAKRRHAQAKKKTKLAARGEKKAYTTLANKQLAHVRLIVP